MTTTWRPRPPRLPARSTAWRRGWRLAASARGRRAGRGGAALVLLGLLGVSAAFAQVRVSGSTQDDNTKNSEAVSVANSAVSITLTATPATRVRLYGITARCSAGSASITLTDGGTTVWSSDAAFVGISSRSVSWVPGYAGGINATLIVTLGACGAGNAGTLDIQADVY